MKKPVLEDHEAREEHEGRLFFMPFFMSFMSFMPRR
jgi:hypothetical protein